MGAERSARGGSAGPSVRVRIPSKLNLFLAVRARRDDGYHDVTSVLQTIGIHDEVTATLLGAGLAHHPAARRLMQVVLDPAPDGDVPAGDDNLAVQAARRLLTALGCDGEEAADGRRTPRTVLALTKSIPVAGGMAGGSADAAAALVACNALWDCDLGADDLRDVAAGLGADVPFCVTGGTALATGRGTATARVLCRGRFQWVVGMSDEPLSTAEVYDTWDRVCTPSEVQPDAVLQALRTGDPVTLGAALHNDLQRAAFELRPGLAEDRRAMLEAGALGAVVSGSGPTVVGLAETRAQAGQLAAAVRNRFDRVEIASSPAGGPEISSRSRPPSAG